MTYVILSGLQAQLSEICLSFVFKGGDSGLHGGLFVRRSSSKKDSPQNGCHIHRGMEELCRGNDHDPRKQAESSEDQKEICVCNLSAYIC